MDNGVAFGPGCQPSASAADASSQGGIPNAGYIACGRCGGASLADASNTAGEWKPIRLELGLCDICAIGEHRAREFVAGRGPKWLIIDGKMYATSEAVPLGSPDPRPNAPKWDKGFGGQRFDFQRFDGPPLTTYSMWHGGEVDEWCSDRMPNNARFLTSAEVASAMSTEGENSRSEVEGEACQRGPAKQGDAHV